MSATLLLHTIIAGTNFRSKADLRKASQDMQPADLLMLEREPTNPHDSKAVKVSTSSGAFLGYVPKGPNAPISRLMAAGKNLQAEVSKHEWVGDWLKVSFRVWLLEGDGAFIPNKAPEDDTVDAAK